MKRQDPIQKATRRIETEGRKHSLCIYSATAIVLWKKWGKRQEAISRFFRASHDVWKQCATDQDCSMIKMCEAETGIEIQNGDGVSWRDVMYLNGTIPENMTYAQVLYMRQQQLKWIRPQLVACMLITLRRKYGFGFERCGRFYQELEEVIAEHRANPDRLRKACYEMTGIDTAVVTTTDGKEATRDALHESDQ